MSADATPSIARTAGAGTAGPRKWPTAVLVAVLAPLPFLPTLWADLLADDFFFAALFRELSTPLSEYVVPALLQMKDVPTTFYRPLAFVTLLAETRAFGGWAMPMHATNLALHSASAVAVWWLASFACARPVRAESHALRPGPAVSPRPSQGAGATSLGAAAVVAALQWAWFPRRVEAVAWLSCRPDLLATALAAWGLAAWIAGARRGNAALRWAGVLLWLAALASKESVALLPLALLALPSTSPNVATLAGDSLRARLARLWPFAIALALLVLLRRMAIGSWVGGYGPGVLVPSIATGLKHLVYPLVPPLEFVGRDTGGSFLLALVTFVVGAFAWAGLWRVRRRSCGRFAIGWVLAAVIPVATLAPSLTSTMNDRLLYVPGIGFALGLACWLAGRSRRLFASSAAIVMVLTLHTFSLAGAWAVAADRTRRIVDEVAAIAREAPAGGALLVAAAPDSFRGAYMLRNGLDFALRTRAGSAAAPLVVLTGYIVEDPAVMPVDVAKVAGGVLHVRSRTGRTEILAAAAAPLEPWATVSLLGSAGSFGRHSDATLTLRRPGLVLVARPDGVERLGEVRPVPEGQ